MAIAAITHESPWLNPVADTETKTIRATTGIIEDLAVLQINGLPYSGPTIGSIVPNQNNAYSLGSSSYRWLNGYINNVIANAITGNSATITNVNLSSINNVPYGGGGSVGDIIPSVNDTSNLGNTDYRWANCWATSLHGQLADTQTTLSSLPAITNANGLVIGAQTISGSLATFTTLAGQCSSAIQSSITSIPNMTNVGGLTINPGSLSISGTTASFTNLTGTITTGAQPNITSIGALNAALYTQSIVANTHDTYDIGTNSVKYATIYATSLNGTLTTAAQPNITSTGTLTSITTSGNILPQTTNSSNIGAFGNLFNNGWFNNLVFSSLTNLAWTTPGIIHNNNAGILSTSLIVNADVSALAAIVDTKLAQITTPGKVANNATTATSANTASAIVARDTNNAFSAGAVSVASLSVGAITSALNTTGSDLLIQNSTTDASIINKIGSTGGNGSQYKIQDSLGSNIMLVDDAGSMYVKDGVYPNTASQGYVGGPSQRFGNAYLVNADIQTNLVCSGLSGSAGIAHISSAGLFSNSQIVNADVSASAAIVDTKLAQITTTNKVADSANTSLAAATSANTASTLVKRSSDGLITVGRITTESGISTFNSADATNQIVLNNTGSTTNRSNYYINNANKRDFEIGLRGSADTYVPYCYSNNTATTGRSTWIWLCDTDLNLQTNGIFPLNDNAYNLGSAGSRWGTVYAATGTINTSDARVKENITASNLGLDFINRLTPVSYKFKDYTAPSIPDNTGNPTPDIQHTFTRKHYGLTAQSVKTVMDTLNISTNDFAGYIYDADSDTYGLRYEEFICPLIQAIKEIKQILNNNNIQ